MLYTFIILQPRLNNEISFKDGGTRESPRIREKSII